MLPRATPCDDHPNSIKPSPDPLTRANAIRSSPSHVDVMLVQSSLDSRGGRLRPIPEAKRVMMDAT